MSLPPKVSMRDIAREAKLHFTTVSLALRNSPKLNADTRARVQALAKEMGYRPDPMLSALNARRHANRPVQFKATIAWIHNWPNPAHLYGCKEFYEYYVGACERADERGYHVEEFSLCAPGITIPRLHRILSARNIQGVLLAPQPEAGRFLDLKYSEISAVSFGFSMHPALLHLVTNHHYHTMSTLLQKAIELGYRKPALCIPKEWNLKVASVWQSVLLLFQEEQSGLKKIPPFWAPWGSPLDENFHRWITTYKPDLLISTSDTARAVKKLGFRIPEDIAFASPFLNRDEPVLSGMHQNDRAIGQKAVDMVIGMLQRGETGIPETPVRMMVESTYHPGQTMPVRMATAADPEKRVAAKRSKKGAAAG